MTKSFQNDPCTVLLCGVGGQGTILAADLLAHCALSAGYEVKLSEVHGMAQRGGAVTTVVRFGDRVASMVTDLGSADFILAFETTEALRNIPFLKSDGKLIVNNEAVQPLPVLTGNASMPENVEERLEKPYVRSVQAVNLAQEAGNTKAVNVVLLGVLAQFLDFDVELWERQIETRVPSKFVDVNLKAFRKGFELE